MTDYYKILGLNSNATLDQIKKAYRSKAKLYHPDISSLEGAHDQFLLINEAYEYLCRFKERKRFNRSHDQQVDDFMHFRREWQAQERRKARERAREYARMKYEAYLQSDLFRTTEAANSFMDFLITATFAMFMVGVPVLAYPRYGMAPVLLSVIIALPTAPIWLKGILRMFSKANIQAFFGFRKASIRTKVGRLMLFSLTNILLFVLYALKAMVVFKWLIAIYGIGFGIAFGLSFIPVSRYRRYLLRWVLAPACIGLFFMLNHVFAFKPYNESYWYTYGHSPEGDLIQTIQLENQHYTDYPNIRFFVNNLDYLNQSRITYTFASGIFGIKVVKNRTITR